MNKSSRAARAALLFLGLRWGRAWGGKGYLGKYTKIGKAGAAVALCGDLGYYGAVGRSIVNKTGITMS